MRSGRTYHCADCCADLAVLGADYYMVQHSLWRLFGAGRGYLCIPCLESRMGRRLTREDFLDCLLTREPRLSGSLRVLSRLGLFCFLEDKPRKFRSKSKSDLLAMALAAGLLSSCTGCPGNAPSAEEVDAGDAGTDAGGEFLCGESVCGPEAYQ